MKFIRLNKDTVKCIVTEDDMQEYGINISDILEQKERGTEFIQYILDEASKEVGRVSQNGMVSIGILMVPGNKISITISDINSDTVEDTINKGKNTAELRKKMEQLEKLKSIIEEIEGEDGKSDKKNIDTFVDNLLGIEKNTEFTLVFENIDAVIDYAEAVENEVGSLKNINSSLYKYLNSYLLTIKKGRMKYSNYVKICFMAPDFGARIETDQRIISLIKEHEDEIIIKKNALAILRNI